MRACDNFNQSLCACICMQQMYKVYLNLASDIGNHILIFLRSTIAGADAFTVSEMIVTLQPNETSAIVNINVIDDHYPEDNETFTITGYTDQTYGRYQNSPLSVTFTINDDDCKFWLELGSTKPSLKGGTY